jgi:N-acetylmuramoyl-L-alanine amidase
VRALHERLIDLGFSPINDAAETYGDATVAAVEAFQRARGLAITGDVDETTWSRLVEAGWRLGHRLLYLDTPNQRGDDVAEMQIRLAQLGFNPGRIDGIFGPYTARALTDFQRNRALASDGTLTRATLQELLRMTPRTGERRLVTDARDLAAFDDAVPGPLVLCGNSPLTTLVADAVGSTFKVEHLAGPDATVAAYANEHHAVAVLSFQVLDELPGVHIHYWASYRSHSRRGEQLASALAIGLAGSHEFPRIEVTGMALPILRETRMMTLHIEHGHHDRSDFEKLADVISQVVGQVFHRGP